MVVDALQAWLVGKLAGTIGDDIFLQPYKELDMLETSKKILLIGASLIALAGSAPAMAASAENTRSTVSEQSQQQVNINNASAADIAKSLKGIGLKTAEAIVAYRDAHGAFKSLESITMVKGIGSKTLKKNSARILLQ